MPLATRFLLPYPSCGTGILPGPGVFYAAARRECNPVFQGGDMSRSVPIGYYVCPMPRIYLAARSPAVGDSFIWLGSLVALRILSRSGGSPWPISYVCRVFYQIKWRRWCKVVVLNPTDATLSATASFMFGMMLTEHTTGHHYSHLLGGR